jgi:glycine/sarcosine/dimethylglycine N-methyltransferase
MDPIERKSTLKPLDVPTFYDLLAPDYDEMTGLENRFVQEKPFFRLLVERYGIKTALDAGCGSGFHSMLLSELGVHVTAVDASTEMLTRTKANARNRGLKIKTIETTFEKLAQVVDKTFDAVFVMGNSLPHLLKADQLSLALANFSGVLKPDGILFVQTLNYDRIMATGDRIQNTKEVGDKAFVRYYEYDGEGILFNILTRTKANAGIDEKLKTIRLRPILRTELVGLLFRNGFVDVKEFGGISMGPFDAGISKDLVILARKPSPL